MNETETEILLAEEASVDVNTDSGRSAIAQKFFAIGVKDAVIITLGSKVEHRSPFLFSHTH